MLMKLRSKMQNQKGFTLVELMVVVVIIGILVAIAVPAYNAVTARAEEAACNSNMRAIAGACLQYSISDPAPADTDYTLANLAGYFQDTPACPSDGADPYAIEAVVDTAGNLDTVTVTCSVHGEYND